ncbi:MAG: FIST C-terminal domain-containing protein [Phycisphaerales bacterium]|nr:FIST C-terminal domain-containing protein [Phycisphaerales bacterium]
MRIATATFSPDGGWSQAEQPIADSASTAVFVFGDSALIDDPGPVAELVSRYPTSHVIGCSTSGHILNDQLGDVGMTCLATRFEASRVASASAPLSSTGASRCAGRVLAESLAGEGLAAVFVLAPGLSVNGSELAGGLQEALPAGVVVTGGLAGDGVRFERTWTVHNGVPRGEQVVALGLYGARVRVTHGSEGGWRGFGPTRRVTRSEGNVLFELDGEPALPLYKRYLGAEAEQLPASALLYPLAVEVGSDMVVRTILGIDEERGSLHFAGDVPEGAKAQFMLAVSEQLLEGAARSAESARPGRDPVLALAVSCAGRRQVLGERTEEELEAVLERLPPGSVMTGFYSHGELSPAGQSVCRLHNQTMTLTAIWEAAA